MGVASRIRARLEKRAAPSTVNFWCHVVEGSFWSFGDALVGLGEVLPVLAVTRLGASNAQLGLMSTVVALSFLAPLFVAPRVEAVRRKKWFILALGLPARVPHLVIVAGLILLGPSAPGACLIVLSLCILAKATAITITIPPWMDLLAETIPPGRTGRL
ncbi:MAG: hypothetical protein KAX19_06250, partial [Candidatus Brocadiae bacterium]|nr:hypothetical protein [Candidatus Brocadiia bacterium]